MRMFFLELKYIPAISTKYFEKLEDILTLGMGIVDGVIVYKNTVQINIKTNCLLYVIFISC